MIDFEANRSDKREYLYHSTNTDFVFRKHMHRSFELNYVFSGELLCEVDGHKFSATAKEAVLTLPGQIHSFDTATSNESILFIFSNDWVEDFCADMRGTTFQPPVCRFESNEFVRLLCDPDTNKYRVRSILYHICSSFYETCPRVKVKESDYALTNAIAAYIEEHYQEKISLTAMAEALGYNHCYLSGFFNRHFGVGFSSYVNGYRIQYAKGYLTATDKKITEIAALCGFETIRNFNRIFRQEFAMTPQEYRRLHAGD